MIDKKERNKYCWLCGTKKEITIHHLEPIKKRKNNGKTIPLCRKHHDQIEGMKYVCMMIDGETYVSPSKIRRIIRQLREGLK